jgi:hypothetical protein
LCPIRKNAKHFTGIKNFGEEKTQKGRSQTVVFRNPKAVLVTAGAYTVC